MIKKKKSGKSLFIRGIILYLWEELKTMNRMKFRALKNMAIGYIFMKMDKKSKDHRALTQRRIKTYKTPQHLPKSLVH